MQTIARMLCSAYLLCAIASAHAELGNYLRHQIQVKAHSDSLDITLEIAFDAARSLKERRGMDINHDGALSKEERSAYLQTVAAKADDALHAWVDDTAITLIPLYEPTLDLQDSADMEAHPHIVRLCYFARAKLQTAKAIRVSDGLWTSEPAIVLAVAAPDSQPGLVAQRALSPTGDSAAKPGDPRIVSFDVVTAGAKSLGASRDEKRPHARTKD